MNKRILAAAGTALCLLSSCDDKMNPFLTDSTLPYGAPQFDIQYINVRRLDVLDFRLGIVDLLLAVGDFLVIYAWWFRAGIR